MLVVYCSALLCRTVVYCYTVLIAVALLLTAIGHEIVCNGIRGEGDLWVILNVWSWWRSVVAQFMLGLVSAALA